MSEFPLDEWLALLETQLQLAYWTHDPVLQADLKAGFPGELSWAQILRLHHLNCMELLSTKSGQSQLRRDANDRSGFDPTEIPDFFQEVADRLVSDESPYRPRHCAVWQGEPGEAMKAEPDLQGRLTNASVTHLGALEVLRLDGDYLSRELDFVSLDEVASVMFGSPGLFRAAKLCYEDGREEIVRLPLLYAPSWKSPHFHDRDGTITRGCCQFNAGESLLGIGVGHQDLMVCLEDGGASLFGLGSVTRIDTQLSIDDPRFREKCRMRGLDPDAMLRLFDSP